MKIKDIKRDKSNYKTIKGESDIDEIIEIPLRKPIKDLYRKNIITIMSSANEINAKWLDEDGNNMYETQKDFDAVKFSYGDGFAYIVFDYDSLSDENKAVMDELYDELNPAETKTIYEEPITAEQSYKGNKRVIYAIHQIENPYHAWKIDSNATYQLLSREPEATQEREFWKRSDFVYTTPYAGRSIIIRYPVTEETETEEIEEYFSGICSKLKEQERRVTFEEGMQNEGVSISKLYEITRELYAKQNRTVIHQPYTTGHLLITEKEKKEIIARCIKASKDSVIGILKGRFTDSMTDEQKYKIIFDYFINTYKYDYSILDTEKALDYFRAAFSKYRNVLRTYIGNIDNYNSMSNYERTQRIIEQIPSDDENKELLSLITAAQKYYSSAHQFKKNRNYRYGNLYASRYGVCQNFSTAFKEICDEFKLPCESVGGHILSDGINVGHAWNAIVIDGEIRFVDISGAIHSKDGTYSNNKPEEFFAVNVQQLEMADNGKNRTLTDESKEKIEQMIKKVHPFNPNGGDNKAIKNSPNDTQNLDDSELSLD